MKKSLEQLDQEFPLLACPFCGGDAHFNSTTTSCKTTIRLNKADTFYGVSCAICSHGSRFGSASPGIMAKMWNSRMQQPNTLMSGSGEKYSDAQRPIAEPNA